MSEEVSRLPYKLKTWLLTIGGRKEASEHATVKEEHLHGPETMAERREGALDYLVKNYFEEKRREAEYTKKLESYGKIRRWIYRQGKNLRRNLTFVTNTILKPSIMMLMTYSTALSLYLGTRIGPQITELTGKCVPQPLNYVLDVTILFPIGFSPGILSIVLSYHLEKKQLDSILREYGVRT